MSLSTSDRARIVAGYGELIVDSTRRIAPSDYVRSAKLLRKVYGRILASVPRSARVVDIGCGDGQFLHFLKTLGFTDLYGFDTSENQLAKCRQYAVDNVEIADAVEWMPRHEKQFDLVVLNHVIEHIPDEQLFDFARLLTGVVSEKGALLITTPNAWSPWVGFLFYTDLTHCRLHTPQSLTQLLAMNGFTAEIFGEGAVAYDLPTTLRWLLWKVREAMLRFDFRVQVGGTRSASKVPLVFTPNVIAFAHRRPS